MSRRLYHGTLSKAKSVDEWYGAFAFFMVAIFLSAASQHLWDVSSCKLSSFSLLLRPELIFVPQKGLSTDIVDTEEFEDSLIFKFHRSRLDARCLPDEEYARGVASLIVFEHVRSQTLHDALDLTPKLVVALTNFQKNAQYPSFEASHDEVPASGLFLTDTAQFLLWFKSFLNGALGANCPYATPKGSVPNRCYGPNGSLRARINCFKHLASKFARGCSLRSKLNFDYTKNGQLET